MRPKNLPRGIRQTSGACLQSLRLLPSPLCTSGYYNSCSTSSAMPPSANRRRGNDIGSTRYALGDRHGVADFAQDSWTRSLRVLQTIVCRYCIRRSLCRAMADENDARGKGSNYVCTMLALLLYPSLLWRVFKLLVTIWLHRRGAGLRHVSERAVTT